MPLAKRDKRFMDSKAWTTWANENLPDLPTAYVIGSAQVLKLEKGRMPSANQVRERIQFRAAIGEISLPLKAEGLFAA